MLSSAIVLSTFVAVCHGGFFPFYGGEPITSAASPYIHGFANPVFHQPLLFNNFYTHQPFFKTFYAPPAQPIFFHQPQPQFLPLPNFITLPSAPAQVQEQAKSAGGYGPPAASGPATGYGAPSGPAAAADASGGYGGSGTGPSGGYGAPPSGPSASSSNADGYGSGPSEVGQTAGTGSEKIEVFEDDFEEKGGEGEAEEEKRADQYQSFIVNKRENEENAESDSNSVNNRKQEPSQGYLPPAPSRRENGGGR